VTPTLGTLDYNTLLLDYRKYFFMKPFTLAMRGMHYGLYGKDSESNQVGALFLGDGSLVRGYSYNSFTNNDCVTSGSGFPISEDRRKGFEDAIKKHPGIKFLGVKYSNNDVAKAANIVSTTAGSNPDFVGVYTAETNNTEGAITGVREAKKEGKIHIVGYDTSDPIVQALHDGKLEGNIVQYPYGEGQKGIETLVKAVNGDSVPRNQTAPFVVATPDNVDTAKVQKYIYKLNC